MIVSSAYLGEAVLSLPSAGYRQLAHDDLLHLLVPQAPIYPNSKILVPVFMEPGNSSGSSGESGGGEDAAAAAGDISAVTIRYI